MLGCLLLFGLLLGLCLCRLVVAYSLCLLGDLCTVVCYFCLVD